MAEDLSPPPGRQRRTAGAASRAGGHEGAIETPNVLGMTESEARATVRAAGLQLIVTDPASMRHPSLEPSASWPIRLQIPTAGTARNVDDIVVASYDSLGDDENTGSVITPLPPDPSGPLAVGMEAFGDRRQNAE